MYTPVVLDRVVSVLMQGPEQLLEALLHPPCGGPLQLVVGAADGVQRVRVARHAQLLLLVDLADDALLVHGLQLALLGLGLLLQSLDRLLEALGHLLLEVLRGGDVVLPHLLVLLLKVGPVLHHLGDLGPVAVLEPA